MPRPKRQQPAQDEGNATPLKRTRPQPKPDTKELIRYLACHFYVRSPLEFIACRPSLGGRDGNEPHNMFDPERPTDLKQHHERKHKLPPHCPRCWQVFKCADQQQDHSRTATSCPVVASAPFVGVTIQQLSEMARAPKGMSAEDRWRRDYAIIFPRETPFTRSPYATPEYHYIDIFTQYIKSIPNVPQASLDAICQHIQSQRLVPRTESLPPPYDRVPGPAAPEAAADVECSAQVVRGPSGEGEISGAASDRAAQLMPMYVGHPDEAEPGPSNVRQDLPIPMHTVNPADLVVPSVSQEALIESWGFKWQAFAADHSK